MSDDISTKQFLRELRALIVAKGGCWPAGKSMSVSPYHLQEALDAKKLPDATILKAMKLEPVGSVRYRYRRIKTG